MSSIAARIWGQMIARVFPHTTVSGEAWQHISNGACSGNGNAGGTTLVDTRHASTGADAYNGAYFLHLLSGAYQGQIRRIVDDDGSGTYTVDASFGGQVASGVEYAIWLSPDPVVVVDSSSGATNMVDATRSEADVDDAPFWLNYYALPITGNRAGEAAQITGFVPGTGTFTLGAGLSGALASGDVVLLRRLIEVSNLNTGGLTQDYHPRSQQRSDFSLGDGQTGARGGTVSFDCALEASGSAAASGSPANASPLRHLLTACGMEESVGTSATVGAGSTVSAIKIATGSWENFAIGQMVVYLGNPTFITSMVDGAAAEDTLNVTPDLPAAPTNSVALSATRMYYPSTDGDVLGSGLEIEMDGVVTLITGIKGSYDDGGDAERMLSFNFSVDQWVRYVNAAAFRPNTLYATTKPVKAEERKCWLTETATNINGFTSTPGTQVAAKPVQGSFGANGRAGYQVTGYNKGATFRELLSSSGTTLPQEARWLARTAHDVIVAHGSHARTVAVRIPVGRLMQVPNPENLDGMQAAPNVIEVQDAGTATDGASAVIRVPDFALHLA